MSNSAHAHSDSNMSDETYLNDGLDLSSQAVLGHFLGREGPDAARTLSFLIELDKVDRWAVDFAEHERVDQDAIALRAFLSHLESVLREHASVLDQVGQTFVTMLAGLTTSRSMLILHYVAQQNEGFIDALECILDRSSDDDVMVATVRRRLQAFQRAQMLGRIFSGARLLRITQIMGSYVNV